MYDPPGPNFIVPTAPVGDSSNQVADTAFVTTAIGNIVPGVSTAYVTANTVANLTSTYGIAQTNTTGFVSIAVSALATSTTLSANVHMNNTTLYFDGPSIAQGTTGTWLASGNITFADAAAVFDIKLWDGNTVIDSTVHSLPAGAGVLTSHVHLSGFIVNPTGNIRISCRDLTTANGTILFNASGNSKDSTITAIRIA